MKKCSEILYYTLVVRLKSDHKQILSRENSQMWLSILDSEALYAFMVRAHEKNAYADERSIQFGEDPN